MNRLPRRRWPSFTQPSTLLLSTTATTGMRYWAAVNSAFIVMAKPPSPQTATQSHYFQSRGAGSVYQPSSIGGMGYALPAAMAAKLRHPERDCVPDGAGGGFARPLHA